MDLALLKPNSFVFDGPPRGFFVCSNLLLFNDPVEVFAELGALLALLDVLDVILEVPLSLDFLFCNLACEFVLISMVVFFEDLGVLDFPLQSDLFLLDVWSLLAFD